MNDLTSEVRGEMMALGIRLNDQPLENGSSTKKIRKSVHKGTLPGFPFIIEIKSETNEVFDIESVMHEKTK